METENMNNAGNVAMDPDAGGPSKNERQWAMGCHLVALCGILIPIPAANVLAPLVVWLLKREDGAFIDDQGKESLNFQISLFIYAIACGMLAIIGIGILLLLPLALFGLVCVIMAAIKASEGTKFRYPVCIRLIK
jgi:uncharacterized Tic20 family protein